MKKPILPLLLLALTIATTGFLLSSCLKNTTSPGLQLTMKQQLIVSRTWTIGQISIPQAGNPAQDSLIQLPCHSKAVIAFGVPNYTGVGNLVFNAGTGGCDTSNDAFHYGQGGWVLTQAQDSMYTQLQGQPVRPMQILALTDSIFKIRFIDSMHTHPNIIKTITFVR